MTPSDIEYVITVGHQLVCKAEGLNSGNTRTTAHMGIKTLLPPVWMNKNRLDATKNIMNIYILNF